MMREEGVLIQLTGRFSNVLALRLPLFFSKDNCDFMTEKLHKIMDRLAQNN
jgi:4-aminobutyrate aminotransferase-like enzyme